ncbi:unnamed protein product [Clavelina lepadiformis]|uniref:7-dehydrocholesterol reductase n=1 Tax=Clavelina lepadiformis TaxID=159417 RepID=A0ABP0F134_CLALP
MHSSDTIVNGNGKVNGHGLRWRQNDSHSNGFTKESNGVPRRNGKSHFGNTQWGRAWSVDFRTLLGCMFVLFGCPLFPMFFHISCTRHDCSLLQTFTAVFDNLNVTTFLSVIPQISVQTGIIYASWVAWQVILSLLPDVLHYVIPGYKGGWQKGAVTPAGNVDDYNINGLQAWLLTHLLWFLNAFKWRIFSPSIVFHNMGAFMIFANIFGYSLTVFSFVKGHLFPSCADDCKFSGSFIYDFTMGIEFNPRIGKLFDFKLFCNGRPGIVCWTIINLSFAWYQKETYGFVSDSMILLNMLQAIYVLDFFWNEAWYLKTIDICHDHFGFYLAWGDFVWLPFMYTLQGLYLAYYPVQLGTVKCALILLLGLVGYFIFRSTNYQKDRFRANPEGCVIWGKKAQYIKCSYVSADGRCHQSSLLTSGWWGVARHMNYTGDLMGSLAYCMCCGAGHILPYFYMIYMTVLLVHRIYRDEHRCQAKYGEHWQKYVAKVSYRLVPGLY